MKWVLIISNSRAVFYLIVLSLAWLQYVLLRKIGQVRRKWKDLMLLPLSLPPFL
jgi:ABC-type molybdate transport system permease subunit